MDNQQQHNSDRYVIKSINGFQYSIPNSVILTKYPSIGIIFFLQSSVRFYDGNTSEEVYKTQNLISHISLCENNLLIGQKMYKGQLTTTTVISIDTQEVKTFTYQKTITTHLNLSSNKQFLCSVGSSDTNRQQLTVIDIKEKLKIGCKIIATETYLKKNQIIVGIEFSKLKGNLLAVLFINKLVLITIEQNTFLKTIAKSNKVREFSMMLFDPYDMSIYACSKNGDISEISLKQNKQVRIGPRKRIIIAGIKHIRYVEKDKLIITGVKGFIALIDMKDLRILKEVTIKEEIVSLTEFQECLGFVATKKANIYVLNAETLEITPFYICNCSQINKICFANNYSQVFATCSGTQIVVWNEQTFAPIIKISLPGKVCNCLYISHDGLQIISGWNDNCIRFFNPSNGKQINKIKNAHCDEVTALVATHHSDQLFSGGNDGSIRIWNITKEKFGNIKNIFNGHKKRVHSLQKYQNELISGSEDGTFGIWNIERGQKIIICSVINFFKKVIVFDEYTLLGVGSGPEMLLIRKNDGKILNKISIGGSFLNDFQMIQNQYDKMIFFLGGEQHNLFIKQFQYLTANTEIDDEIELFSSYGQITSLAVSPDKNNIIVGTIEGYLINFSVSKETKSHLKLKKRNTIV